ncbi:hypothetical protein C0993_000751 [Termitomyces sp. T159_Od127]|nr:hypothetical protein C0993_000751 [Termitomyces sp. T159_Od127]
MNKHGTGPPVPPPKYLNDFSKALLSAPALTNPSEIAELMQMKSKHSSGGEFAPDWKPPVRPLPASH